MKNLVLFLSLFLVSVQTLAGIPVTSSFTMNAALPLDDRATVADLTARDALPALRRWEGMLVYVVSEQKHFTLKGGIADVNWSELSGSGAGLSTWITATPYVVDDIVVESNKIYKCLTNHTSGTFSVDFASNYWVELSDSNDKITGPASSTDNAIVRYDSTTGKLAKNSGVTISDTNDVSGAKDISASGDITLTGSQFNSIKVGAEIARQITTGVVDGALLSINADPTKFNLSAQVLSFSDYSSSLSAPDVNPINCPAQSAVAVANLATADSTYISVSPSCTIIQSTTFPTQVQRRTNAFIGRLSHVNRTSVTAVANLPDLVVGSNSQLYDLYDAIGPFNISGNVISPNGANLSFNRSAGSIFRRSANYSSSKQNPHVVSFSGATASNFFRSTQTATNPTPVNVIDVANYDVAGTVTAIPGVGGTSTNRRVYIFSTGAIAIQYGQVTYGSLANAIAGITTESFVVNPQLSEGGVLLAIISCRKDATNLSNTAQCKITKTGRFDQTGVTVGSLSTTTLNQAYDNSVSPQITTSTTGGSVDIKRGSAADTDNVLTAQNGAGSTTWSVKGTGEVKSLSKISADNVFRDSNLLTNPSFENSTIGTGWTFVNGSCNSSSGVAVDGSVNCSFTSTGANWSASQCSTTNAPRLAGQEMENSVWLGSASTTDPIWVCPGTNGVYPTPSVDNGCMRYTNIGNIQPLKNYFLGDSASTSNCIRISGSNSGTTVGIDKAYTGLRTTSEVSGEINTPWVSCNFSTLAWQGLGTVTNNLECRRDGPNLKMRGVFSVGTVTSSSVQIPLPSNWGAITTQASSGGGFGKLLRSVSLANTMFNTISISGASYFNVSGAIVSQAVNPTTAVAGTNFVSNNDTLVVDGELTIPIAEWQNNINAFSLKCDDPRQCETVFSARVSSTGVVSGENLDWINGNGSGTSPYTINFNTGIFSVTPACVTSLVSPASGVDAWIESPSSSSVVVRPVNNVGPTTINSAFTISCQKQGADYLNSRITQQIVQMREVPRTPGAVRTDIFGARYTGSGGPMSSCTSIGNCTLSHQVGNIIVTIAKTSTGAYLVTLSKNYKSLSCTYTPTGAQYLGGQVNGFTPGTNTLSIQSGVPGTGAADSFGTINCIGEY